MEDKVEELQYSDKDKEKILLKYKQYMQDLWETIKRPNLQIVGIEEGEMVQAKGIASNDSIISPILRKRGFSRYRRFIGYQTDKIKKNFPKAFYC
jgi:hypothetical protein